MTDLPKAHGLVLTRVENNEDFNALFCQLKLNGDVMRGAKGGT